MSVLLAASPKHLFANIGASFQSPEYASSRIQGILVLEGSSG
jgi:hypothetical protein